MLRHVPEPVWDKLARNGARTGVFSRDETTCYYPEYARHADTPACRSVSLAVKEVEAVDMSETAAPKMLLYCLKLSHSLS